jgi:uncharacterized protein YegL
MAGTKIATLNQAIREALPAIRNAVAAHPEVEIQMRAIKFADNATWHEQFVWPELSIAGATATAQAIRLLASQLTEQKMPRRGYPPVCVLISDGFCTDPPEDYGRAIAELRNLSWGKRAVRLAIAIQDDSGYSEGELLNFISHPEIGVLKANTPAQLVDYIRWASVAATVGASAGKSKVSGADPNANFVPLPPPPVPAASASPLDVF